MSTAKLNLDHLPECELAESSLVPVAKISRFFHKPLISANSKYIAYPTAKRGIIRVIDQNDGNHITLDTTSCGGGADIESLEFKTYSNNQTALFVQCPQVMYWIFNHDEELIEAPKGTLLNFSIPEQPQSQWKLNVWVPESQAMLKNTVLVVSTSADHVFVTDISGVPLKQYDGVGSSSNNIVSEIGLGKFVSIDSLYEEDPKIIAGLLDGELQDVTNKRAVGKIQGRILSVNVINNSDILVISTEEISVWAAGSKTAKVIIQFSKRGFKLDLARFLAPYLVCLDTQGNMIIFEVASNLTFSSVARIATNLEVFEFTITKNLEQPNVAFDLYLIHNKGLSIAYITKDMLVGAQTPLKYDTLGDASPVPAMSANEDTAAAENFDKKEETSFQALIQSQNAKPKSSSVSAASSPSPQALASQPMTPKLKGKKQKVLDSSNLTDSYSREEIKERTYHINDLISAGVLVSAADHEKMKNKLTVQVHRLENRVSSLEKKVESFSKKEREKEKEMKKIYQLLLRLSQPEQPEQPEKGEAREPKQLREPKEPKVPKESRKEEWRNGKSRESTPTPAPPVPVETKPVEIAEAALGPKDPIEALEETSAPGPIEPPRPTKTPDLRDSTPSKETERSPANSLLDLIGLSSKSSSPKPSLGTPLSTPNASSHAEINPSASAAATALLSGLTSGPVAGSDSLGPATAPVVSEPSTIDPQSQPAPSMAEPVQHTTSSILTNSIDVIDSASMASGSDHETAELSFEDFEQQVLQMVAEFNKPNSSLDELAKRIATNYITYDFEKCGCPDEVHNDMVLLSAVSCFSSVSHAEPITNQMLKNLLGSLTLSAPELYEDDGAFVNSVIKRAKKNFIEHGGNDLPVLHKFNYQEKVTSAKL